MPWEDELFEVLEDLEQQAEALYDRERQVELVDRSRAEYAQVSLGSRLMASVDHAVELDLMGAGRISGEVGRVGPDWLLVHGAGQDWLLRIAAITRATGISERSVPEVAWSPISALRLGSALRRIADTGEPCRLHLVDGTTHEGVLWRVGADFVEARGAGGRVFLTPYEGLAAVQRRD